MIEDFQTIVNDGDCAQEHNNWSSNSVEDYMRLKDSVNQIIAIFNDGEASPQFGSGSPEGVVTANYSLFYIDTVANTLYYNQTFGSDTSWIAL